MKKYMMTAGVISPFDVTGKKQTLVKDRTGEITSYTGDGISFKTAYVPGGLAFPGYNDNDSATVVNAYELGETEVTYELWHKVRSWAESNGYTFYNNPGREGSSPTNQNTTPSGNKQEPVTYVTWFDAVVWLNALTEWVNTKAGKSFTPVYYYDSGYATVATNSNPASNFSKENSSYEYASAYAKPGATGFRLPSNNEWELAARWRGNDPTNTVSGYTDPYFTQGDSASGAAAGYSDTTATEVVAWYSGNASGKTHPVGQKAANGLGLYDMSGNVVEWCFDWRSTGFYRYIRGGSWDDSANYLRVGGVDYNYPDSRYSNIGFRPAKSAQ
jgi:formylglycine-generating enzyme required for sulfatase activity